MSTVKKVPQRQCIGCGEMKNKRELIRVLKGTDYVKSRGLERSFKMAIPKEVYESLKKEMEQIDEQK